MAPRDDESGGGGPSTALAERRSRSPSPGPTSPRMDAARSLSSRIAAAKDLMQRLREERSTGLQAVQDILTGRGLGPLPTSPARASPPGAAGPPGPGFEGRGELLSPPPSHLAKGGGRGAPAGPRLALSPPAPAEPGPDRADISFTAGLAEERPRSSQPPSPHSPSPAASPRGGAGPGTGAGTDGDEDVDDLERVAEMMRGAARGALLSPGSSVSGVPDPPGVLSGAGAGAGAGRLSDLADAGTPTSGRPARRGASEEGGPGDSGRGAPAGPRRALALAAGASSPCEGSSRGTPGAEAGDPAHDSADLGRSSSPLSPPAHPARRPDAFSGVALGTGTHWFDAGVQASGGPAGPARAERVRGAQDPSLAVAPPGESTQDSSLPSSSSDLRSDWHRPPGPGGRYGSTPPGGRAPPGRGAPPAGSPGSSGSLAGSGPSRPSRSGQWDSADEIAREAVRRARRSLGAGASPGGSRGGSSDGAAGPGAVPEPGFASSWEVPSIAALAAHGRVAPRAITVAAAGTGGGRRAVSAPRPPRASPARPPRGPAGAPARTPPERRAQSTQASPAKARALGAFTDYLSVEAKAGGVEGGAAQPSLSMGSSAPSDIVSGSVDVVPGGCAGAPPPPLPLPGPGRAVPDREPQPAGGEPPGALSLEGHSALDAAAREVDAASFETVHAMLEALSLARPSAPLLSGPGHRDGPGPPPGPAGGESWAAVARSYEQLPGFRGGYTVGVGAYGPAPPTPRLTVSEAFRVLGMSVGSVPDLRSAASQHVSALGDSLGASAVWLAHASLDPRDRARAGAGRGPGSALEITLAGGGGGGGSDDSGDWGPGADSPSSSGRSGGNSSGSESRDARALVALGLPGPAGRSRPSRGDRSASSLALSDQPGLVEKLGAVRVVLAAREALSREALRGCARRLRQVERDIAYTEHLERSARFDQQDPSRTERAKPGVQWLSGAAGPGQSKHAPTHRREPDRRTSQPLRPEKHAWEGSRFKLALLRELAVRLRAKLALMALQVNASLRRDRENLVDQVHWRARQGLLRAGLGALVLGAEERRAKQRAADAFRARVVGEDKRAAFWLWRSWAGKEAVLTRSYRLVVALRERLLKRSALAHWAALATSQKLARLGQAAAVSFHAKSVMLRPFTAWRHLLQTRRALGDRISAASRPRHISAPPGSHAARAGARAGAGAGPARPEALTKLPAALRAGFERVALRFEAAHIEIHLCKQELRRLAPHLRFGASDEDVARWAAWDAVKDARREAHRREGVPDRHEDSHREARGPVPLPPLSLGERLNLGELGRRRVTRDALGRVPGGPGEGALVPAAGGFNVSTTALRPEGSSAHELPSETAAVPVPLLGVPAGFDWPAEHFGVGSREGWGSLRGVLVDLLEAMTSVGGSSKATAVLRAVAGHMLESAHGDAVELRFVAEGVRIAARQCAAGHARHVRFLATLQRLDGLLTAEVRVSSPVPGFDGVLSAGHATALAAGRDVAGALAQALGALRAGLPGVDPTDAATRPLTCSVEEVATLAAAVAEAAGALSRAQSDPDGVDLALGRAAGPVLAAAERAVAMTARARAAAGRARSAVEATGRVAAEVAESAAGGLSALLTSAGVLRTLVEEPEELLRRLAAVRREMEAGAERAEAHAADVDDVTGQAVDFSMAAFEAKVSEQSRVTSILRDTRAGRPGSPSGPAPSPSPRAPADRSTASSAAEGSASSASMPTPIDPVDPSREESFAEAAGRVRDAEAREAEAFLLVEDLVEQRAALAQEGELARLRAAEVADVEAVAGKLPGYLDGVGERHRELEGELEALALAVRGRLGAAEAALGRMEAEAEALGAAAGLLARAGACARVPWGDLDRWRSAADELPDEGPRRGAQRGRVEALTTTFVGLEGAGPHRGAPRRPEPGRYSDDGDGPELDTVMGSLTQRIAAEADLTSLLEIGFHWDAGATWDVASPFFPESNGTHVFGVDESELLIYRPELFFYNRFGSPCEPEEAGFERYYWWLEGARGSHGLLDFAPPGTRGANWRGGAAMLDYDSDEDEDGDGEGRGPRMPVGTRGGILHDLWRVRLDCRPTTPMGQARLFFLRKLARRTMQSMLLWERHSKNAAALAEARGQRALKRRMLGQWAGWAQSKEASADCLRQRNLLASSMLGWALWMHRRAAALQAAIEATQHYHRQLQAKALASWISWNQRRQLLRENYHRVVAARHRGRLRLAFEHWQTLAAQKALLVRVFSRAQEAWDACEGPWNPEYRHEFDIMERYFGRWRERADERRRLREDAAMDLAAEAYRSTSLAHRALAALRTARDEAGAVERTKRAVFRAWWAAAAKEALNPFGLSAGRAKLRAAGLRSEMEYDRRRLLRKGLEGMRLAAEAARRPRELAEGLWRGKVLTAFAEGARRARGEDDARIAGHRGRWGAERPLKKAFRVWAAVAKRLRRNRDKEFLAEAVRGKMLQRRALAGLREGTGVDATHMGRVRRAEALRAEHLKRRALHALSRFSVENARARLNRLIYGAAAPAGEFTGGAPAPGGVDARGLGRSPPRTGEHAGAAVARSDALALLAAVKGGDGALIEQLRGTLSAGPAGGGPWRGALPRAPDQRLDGTDVELLTRAMGVWKLYNRHYRELMPGASAARAGREGVSTHTRMPGTGTATRGYDPAGGEGRRGEGG